MGTLVTYRATLAYLNSEESSPNPAPASRDAFINIVIDDVWRRYQWPFRRSTANIAFTNGVGTLPTDFDVDGFYTLTHPTDLTRRYGLIEEQYKNNYSNGSNQCWITGSTINIHETDNPTLALVYWSSAPTLTDTSTTCSIPDIVIGSGAYALMKAAEDDEYDTRPLDSKYEREFAKYRSQTINGGLKDSRMVGPTEKSGAYIGKVE